MRLRNLILVLLLAVPPALAEGLPDLGDVSQATFTPAQERELGDQIMREIHADPHYYDDAEATDYINKLGDRLVAHSNDAHQKFDFFLMRDNEINAFALPGGYIGVNTGLLLLAQNESEVAAVLSHELGHVIQHHVARMLAVEGKNQLLSIASLAVAILAARTSYQGAAAAMSFGQAGVIQSQLNFTRANEREADRVGLQILEASGFDPRAMPAFFERLQRATRLEEGDAPSYLRTHPLTSERIADIENRIANYPYRQVPDSLDFQLIRAKLRADLETPRVARDYFKDGLADGKFFNKSVGHYGLAASLLRLKDVAGAQKQFALIDQKTQRNPVAINLGCEIRTAAGDTDGAQTCYRNGLAVYPSYRMFTYGYADLLLKLRKPQAALQLLKDHASLLAKDHRYYLVQSHAYAMLGKPLSEHRALGEAYFRMGNLSAAIEQYQIALKSGEGDFYQLSETEARLRQLRALDADARRDKKKQ